MTENVCQNCGSRAVPGKRFCKSCGHTVAELAPSSQATHTVARLEPVSPAPGLPEPLQAVVSLSSSNLTVPSTDGGVQAPKYSPVVAEIPLLQLQKYQPAEFVPAVIVMDTVANSCPLSPASERVVDASSLADNSPPWAHTGKVRRSTRRKRSAFCPHRSPNTPPPPPNLQLLL